MHKAGWSFLHQPACLIHAMYCKDVLGEINSDGDNDHDFSFKVS